MKYILFILLIISIYLTIIYYTKKLSILKHQLLVADKHNRHLKKQLAKYKDSSKYITVQFFKTDFSMGIINTNSKVYLCPIEDSILIYRTNIKMEVVILDKCINDNLTWYYILLPLDTNINSRGWINKNCFSNLYTGAKKDDQLK